MRKSFNPEGQLTEKVGRCRFKSCFALHFSFEENLFFAKGGELFMARYDHGPRNTTAAHEKCRIFKTPEEFAEAAEEYFVKCDNEEKLYGEAGLCLHLSKVAGRPVSLASLRNWYDGTKNKDLQEVVQQAYLRIQEQIESAEAYQQKGMVTKAIFLSKQARLGGLTDKQEVSHDAEIKVTFGSGVEPGDFE